MHPLSPAMLAEQLYSLYEPSFLFELIYEGVVDPGNRLGKARGRITIKVVNHNFRFLLASISSFTWFERVRDLQSAVTPQIS